MLIVRTEDKEILFGQNKASDTIEGIDLLRQHEKLPEDYKMEYDILLDDKQLKKLKILKMKFNAEKVQSRKVNVSKKIINEWAGDKNAEESEDEEDEEFEEGEGRNISLL